MFFGGVLRLLGVRVCVYYLKETCLSSLQVKLFTYFVSTIGTCVEKTMTGSLSSKESYTSHTFTL